MTLERLQRKRQKSVAEQNLLSEAEIRATACYWREHPLPHALHETGVAHGVVWEASALLDLVIDFPGDVSLSGLLLNQAERFIAFELDTDPEHRVVQVLCEWRDVTAEQNVSAHNRGFGVGYGALALKVLRELNG